MSFKPLGESLLGVGTPGQLFERNIYENPGESKASLHTVILVVISAIVFVTVISIYDVLRNFIKLQSAKGELRDHKDEIPPEDLVEAEISDRLNLNSSIIFSLIAILSAIILIPLLIVLDRKI